ncbi:MAG: hypothetical protein QM767_18515 [Anaeromyxobacter sp.]
MTMRLALTGVGLVTALGRGATGSCAALRAGVALPVELGAEVEDGEGGMIPAAGYPTGLADGFFQTGAWVRLATAALEDLGHQSGFALEDAAGWQRSGLTLLLPAILEPRFRWTPADATDLIHQVTDPVASLLRLPAAPAQRSALGGGCTGLASALEGALRQPAQTPRERWVLAAADSYVDGLSLSWLALEGRLKEPGQPVGLAPGEAGAALLLETEHAARQRRAQPLGFIESVALTRAPAGTPPPASPGEEGPTWAPPPAPALGRALAQALRGVLPAGPAPWHGDLYLDLNGETWKAAGWGHAQVDLVRVIAFDRCRVIFPAESLGETGAASPLIGVALALWNLRRDGAPGAIVCSIGDDGQVAAVRLGPAAPAR